MSFYILSNLSRRLRGASRWLVAPALAIVLAACGGGSSMTGSNTNPQGCTSSTCGSMLTTITDATGDFTTYTVNVTSLQMTKADGAVVETLPKTTRIDFTQLVDLTEFFTAATIPTGEYVAVTMTLDFSAAATPDIEVDGTTGTSVPATLEDSGGNPLNGPLTLTVQLDSGHHLFIAPGIPARLALDFNLAASNEVSDVTATAAVVEVEPVLVASIQPLDTKQIRVRGTLVSVDTTSYTVELEPFDNQSSDGTQVTVNTTAQTTYEINGASYTGAAGVTAMQALASGTLTVAFGTLSTNDGSFTAANVLAGSSVQSPSLDRLQGIVIQRTNTAAGATLIVRNGTLHMHGDQSDHFNAKNVTLTIAGTTMFKVAGEPSAAPDITWPSIGSEITAFGTAGTDMSGNPTFDATAAGDEVRLEITTLWGLQLPVPTIPGQVVLNLQAIEGLSPSDFTFTGSGSNPASYVVATGALPLTGVTASAPLRFFGLVQPYLSTPPDFNAQTLVNFAAVSATLDVGFRAGSTTGFTTVSMSDLVVNLAGSTTHVIKIGPESIDLTTLPASPQIIPNPTGVDMFAILDWMAEMPAGVGLYSSYATFEPALSGDLTATTKVLRVFASGQYDQASNTFTASQIAVVLKN
ncbi:MAG TPA: DUF4382 domain-containing protein [Steroidobacteraceae bacterium]|nr:DUF4382 domain-containing protein [Steroidobacteraceae bacterium]